MNRLDHNDGLPRELKQKICKVLNALFPDATIYLYGSRARGDYHERSDIDLAIDNGPGKERLQLGEAKAVLEGLHNPYKIDIVDLHYLPEHMAAVILKEGIPWQS